MDVDFSFRTPRRSDAEARLWRNAQGRDEGVCQQLAAGVDKADRAPVTHMHLEGCETPPSHGTRAGFVCVCVCV